MRTYTTYPLCPIAIGTQDLEPIRELLFYKPLVHNTTLSNSPTVSPATSIDMVNLKKLWLRFSTTDAPTAVMFDNYLSKLCTPIAVILFELFGMTCGVFMFVIQTIAAFGMTWLHRSTAKAPRAGSVGIGNGYSLDMIEFFGLCSHTWSIPLKALFVKITTSIFQNILQGLMEMKISNSCIRTFDMPGDISPCHGGVPEGIRKACPQGDL
jgi:hypothetical protein